MDFMKVAGDPVGWFRNPIPNHRFDGAKTLGKSMGFQLPSPPPSGLHRLLRLKSPEASIPGHYPQISQDLLEELCASKVDPHVVQESDFVGSMVSGTCRTCCMDDEFCEVLTFNE